MWTLRIADAALHVGPIEDDLAVESAGPQQGRVENVGAVRGGDDDDVRVRVEAVHLDEDLVERLLALVVRATEAGATLAADRVDLVDEDDAGAVALGLVEQVADAARADADEHLDELGARDREERHAGLAGHGPRQKRLAGARRPDEEDAPRDPRAERIEFLGVLQELDDFLELGLGLVDAGDVVERHDGLVAEEHASAALAEAQGLVIGALRLPHHEQDEAADEDQRQEARQDEADPRGVGCLLGLVARDARVAALRGRGDVGRDLRQDGRDVDRVFRRAAGGRHGQGLFLLNDRFDLAGPNLVEELEIADCRCLRRLGDPRPEKCNGADHEDQHHDAVAEELRVQVREPPDTTGDRSADLVRV